jgi:hypothetical protein
MGVPQQLDTLTNIIQNAIEEALSNTHTSTIAKVTKINGSTIDAKPVFKRVINDTEVELPVFTEIPILTLQGGSNYRIMPIAVGDYALLIFAERCIDDWYFGADNKKPREYRIHDYSDAIAIVGLNNINNAISIPSGHEKVNGDIVHTGDNTQTGDYNITGNQIIEGNYTQEGNMTIEGNFTLTGEMQVNGNITCTGTITGGTVVAGNFTGTGGGDMSSTVNITTTGEVTANGKNLSTHTHTAPSGGGTTTPPN